MTFTEILDYDKNCFGEGVNAMEKESSAAEMESQWREEMELMFADLHESNMSIEFNLSNRRCDWWQGAFTECERNCPFFSKGGAENFCTRARASVHYSPNPGGDWSEDVLMDCTLKQGGISMLKWQADRRAEVERIRQRRPALYEAMALMGEID